MTDRIVIDGLELQANLGVPEEERATPQRLTANLVLEPAVNFGDLADRIGRTVDYAAVCRSVTELAAGSRCQLLETLAGEMAEHLLKNYAVQAVEIELRKYILPETNFVAVQLRRGW